MDMMQTISLLYELSLAIGTSLDINENTKSFLNVTMRRLNIDFASVWIRDEHLNIDHSNGCSLVHAYPEFRIKSRHISDNHPLIQDFGNKPFKKIRHLSDELNDFLAIEEQDDTYCIIYKLENLGFIMFYAAKAWDKSQNVRFRQLKDVMKKFTLSLQACLAYHQSQLETKKNEALAKLAKEREQAIRAMSTPIAQLWQNILLLPLVGSLDEHRSQTILRTILEKINQTQSKVFILDISGIIDMNEYAVQQLAKIAKSTRLMGCKCILSGISGQVAQHMVSLNLDIHTLSTTSTMRDALDIAFKQTGTILSASTSAHFV